MMNFSKMQRNGRATGRKAVLALACARLAAAGKPAAGRCRVYVHE
jgi:hypothetical protein